MKTLLVALFAFAGIATAEPIDLYTTAGFGALKQFHSVQNSDGVQLDQDGNPLLDEFGNPIPTVLINIILSSSTVVTIDGITCFGSGGTAYEAIGLTLACDDGSSIVYSATYTSRRVCNRSGRGGGYCHDLWTLVDGLIER